MTQPPSTWKINLQNGLVNLQPIDLKASNLDQVSLQLPSGAYTTLRTYHHTKVLHLEAHFDRLEETTALAGLPIELDRQALRAAMREVLASLPKDREIRMRLTIALQDEPGALWLSAELLKVPSARDYRHGVKVITYSFQRSNPRAKLTQSIERSSEIRQALPPDVNEALLVDPSGCILEGLSSNFFGIQSGVIWTANEGVLEGITRAQVLALAETAGFSMRYQAVKLADLATLHEAFITSASRGILPVCQVDERIVASGKPGLLTRQLMLMFDASLAENCQEI